MNQVEIREGARRQHRGLGMFCALYCWNHDKKAVVVQKEVLLRYLGLERMKEKRFEWICEDISAYFPHIFQKTTSVDMLVFSKIPESDISASKNDVIQFTPKVLNLAAYNSLCILDGGDKTQDFIDESMPFLSEVNNLHEYAITNTLTMLACGVISPVKALE